jgi:YidC/Oxa1 family membrane protein insertase
VDGSILLSGARIDDLNLRDYRETIDRTSPEVTLLQPNESAHGHDAFFGWESRNGETVNTLADSFSGWTAPEGARLTVATPVTLTLTTAEGLRVERTIAIDEHYMFTITDVVHNETGAAVSVRPFGAVRSQGLPENYHRQPIVLQGMTGVFGPQLTLHETRFEDANKLARDKARGRAGEDERIVQEQGEGGWLGVTDHYWLTAMVLPADETVSAYYDARPEAGFNSYRAAYRGEWHDAPAGGSVTYTQRLFAGAKRADLIRGYQDDLAIPDFDKSIDWGNFWFLTRPFFAMLDFFGKLVGNFGIAILLSTIVVKLALFPLIYQSYKAMAKLRLVQPKMKEIQDRYAADKQRQQQEMIKLYQTEKINPVSGCVPILFQIPIFFALYKTLSVTIEMRHAPFFGWIRDLSAPDPTSIFNLFGLLPAIGLDFHSLPVIGAIIPAIGIWPILYGLSMWALQHLSPPPADPIQGMVFKFMPFVFTFMFAGFAVGMVIYWTWSNFLSILQQYWIMRRQGVETQFDMFLAKVLKRPEAKPAE